LGAIEMKKEAVLAFAFTIIASFYFSQILVEAAQTDNGSAPVSESSITGAGN